MITRLDLFKSLPQGATVLEVGVYCGDFMQEIVTARPDLHYTGIDTWRGSFGWAREKAEAKERALGIYPALFVEDSLAAAKRFGQKPPLGCVYLDADHTFESVTKDIEAWWPNVKRGGILSGHDYETKPAEGAWGKIEVEQAVDKWASKLGLTVNVIRETCPTWWVVKP